MTAKEQLIQELTQVPDFLAEEVLSFLLFLKMRLGQRVVQQPSAVAPVLEPLPFLSFVDRLTAQIPPEDRATVPNDLSKNLDHYLYGTPKVEE